LFGGNVENNSVDNNDGRQVLNPRRRRRRGPTKGQIEKYVQEKVKSLVYSSASKANTDDLALP